ncbi:EAL domain-containing protein [Cellulomonas cellasea]|uniref:EAL and modified HD-GYP domain-containing signal transduction protein n=1 Tax=Cellulomonas cellasea TaxID=43670 RepID=A0A7W4UCY6_9CELL|nr:EAL domain-containing protein [Cellulomonas cellasea]MBB2921380.1 EAL and modified HD-GYP domain-containing signal transduction protein [Cellulomonas cellasea]
MTLAAPAAAPRAHRRRHPLHQGTAQVVPGEAVPALGPRIPVGRQPITGADGTPQAYEFLYRSLASERVGVDGWAAAQQDLATGAVLHSVFADRGVVTAAAGRPAFVNVTRSFLVGALPLPADPARLVLEVVESVQVDAEVVAGVARLRAAGFRIAVDDFVALPDQVRLLPYADYVKIDHRDLVRHGQPLLDLAARHGARLVAEHLETTAALDACVAAGFSLFQGDVVAPTVVLPGAVPTHPIGTQAKPSQGMETQPVPAEAMPVPAAPTALPSATAR